MKLRQLFRPIDWKKRDELETALEAEKERLRGAGQRATDALRKDLAVATLVREYPYQSAVVLLLGGYLLARKVAGEVRAKGLMPMPLTREDHAPDLADELGTEQA